MKNILITFWIAVFSGGGLSAEVAIAPHGADTHPLVAMAAREVQRYVYLRTGELLPIVDENPAGRTLISLAVDKDLTR